jgi:hypothetical protein
LLANPTGYTFTSNNFSRFPSVALYDTLGQNAVEFVLKHAEVKTVICAGKQLQQVHTIENC